VVRKDFRINHEYHFVCCVTIILKFPWETFDIKNKTITNELIYFFEFYFW